MVGGCGSGVTGEPLAGVFDSPSTMDARQLTGGALLPSDLDFEGTAQGNEARRREVAVTPGRCRL
jgi:hypothetical protein